MKKILSIIILFLLVSSLVAVEATEPPKQILKKGDVVKFIKTFPLLKTDLEKLGAKYEARKGDVTIPEALVANTEFRNILTKHGWDEQFFQKSNAILMAFSSIVYSKSLKTANSEIEKSLKEIDTNPNIPDSMKKQLKEQMMAAQGMASAGSAIYKKNVHPADLALIKPHIEALKAVFEAK